jgi:hypothetical protein
MSIEDRLTVATGKGMMVATERMRVKGGKGNCKRLVRGTRNPRLCTYTPVEGE